MRTRPRFPVLLLAFALGFDPAWASPARPLDPEVGLETALHFPWRQAGLSERQAAAHLLDRFSYGARPGEVDAVVAEGLEPWFLRQLDGSPADRELARRLEPLETLDLSLSTVVERYRDPGLLLREAYAAGALSELPDREGGDEGQRREQRREVMRYAREMGYRSQRQLLGELLAQRLYRAVYAEGQLHEVLADFWLNHFYVSLADAETRSYVPAFERDAVRPHLLGSFGELLAATARHPAMLLYLDNARSVANPGQPTLVPARREGRGERGQRSPREAAPRRRADGLNENYARELLELHTLGVDGGYGQQDVVEVARAFTGWTVIPPGPRREMVEERIARARRQGVHGLIVDGEFLFRPDAHDAGAKTVLGQRLAAGRGIEDGEEVLALLARHPATARHLARKLAVRFVSDDPPPALVDRLAATFTSTGGDLRAVVLALACSPELWAPAARRAKIKSPFELAASALRGLDADVEDPAATLEWVARMGQPLYLHPAPTGYPDQAEAWVSTGSLLERMSFAAELAAGRIAGVRLPPAAEGERATRRELLARYLPRLLPERESPVLLTELEAAAASLDLSSPAPAAAAPRRRREGDGAMLRTPIERLFPRREAPPVRLAPPTEEQRVLAAILGSPEFQRR